MKMSMLHVGVNPRVLGHGSVCAGQKYTCRPTGKTLNQCCCEMKDGKFSCKLTKKTYDRCCCDMK